MAKASNDVVVTNISIPGYLIEAEIGRGGVATVYLAIQQSLDRKVALKVMSPALAAEADYSERFEREGRTVARFTHPNIVTIFDVGVANYQHYIAMEHLAGGSLKSQIGTALDTGRALEITRQIAHALGYAHDHGYVHRDVKPENILFRSNGEAVLTDFGIAKSAGSDTQYTRSGTIIGTPRYMSPEQAQGHAATPQSDIYALGVILFEMLTGRPPYETAESIAVLYSHINDPIPSLPPSCDALQNLVNVMMAKDPVDRVPDCETLGELIALSKRELAQPTVTKRQTRALELAAKKRAATSSRSKLQVPQEAVAARELARRSRFSTARFVVAIGTLVALALGLAWLYERLPGMQPDNVVETDDNDANAQPLRDDPVPAADAAGVNDTAADNVAMSEDATDDTEATSVAVVTPTQDSVDDVAADTGAEVTATLGSDVQVTPLADELPVTPSIADGIAGEASTDPSPSVDAVSVPTPMPMPTTAPTTEVTAPTATDQSIAAVTPAAQAAGTAAPQTTQSTKTPTTQEAAEPQAPATRANVDNTEPARRNAPSPSTPKVVPTLVAALADKPIDELLDIAAERFADDRVHTPAGDNAIEIYQYVIAVRPGEKRASAGLSDIADEYYARAEKRFAQDDLSAANVDIQRGLDAQPDHADLLALRDRVQRQAESETAFKDAEAYFFGDGVEQDYDRAYRNYRQAAEFGSVDAMVGLAICLARGIGVAEDNAAALDWFEQAATLGNVEAQYWAGLGYVFSSVIDHDSAAYWMKQAVEQDYKRAYRVLGWMYQFGVGVDASIAGAVKHGYKGVFGEIRTADDQRRKTVPDWEARFESAYDEAAGVSASKEPSISK